MPIAKRELNNTNSMNVSTQVSNPLEAKNDTVRIFAYIEQVRIHNTFSRERWAGALMEIRTLFSLNFSLVFMGGGREAARIGEEVR